eukprot:101197-Prorocentrum_minimum.AAC.1
MPARSVRRNINAAFEQTGLLTPPESSAAAVTGIPGGGGDARRTSAEWRRAEELHAEWQAARGQLGDPVRPLGGGDGDPWGESTGIPREDLARASASTSVSAAAAAGPAGGAEPARQSRAGGVPAGEVPAGGVPGGVYVGGAGAGGVRKSVEESKTVFANRPALAALPGLDRPAGDPLQELHYPDGKVERVYTDGRRSVRFANGTRKEQLGAAEGSVTVVFFVNGDVKRAHPASGQRVTRYWTVLTDCIVLAYRADLAAPQVDYYYAEVDTWHTTHPDGTEVYHFPGGQVRDPSPHRPAPPHRAALAPTHY